MLSILSIKRIYLFLSLMLPFLLQAQKMEGTRYRNKSYVIAGSFKNGDSAYARAMEASKKLDIRLQTEETFSPRGHYNNDSVFVSIEESGLYRDFEKGYWIVVIASGKPNDKSLKGVLKKVKEYFPDAYIKTSAVYVGHEQ